MKIGIMQPYLFPYIGYFQLINAVDRYVIYDDVDYIKGGWINRNNILVNKQKHLFTVILDNPSPNKLINEIFIKDDFSKLLKTIHQAYGKAPYYKYSIPIIEQILTLKDRNLGSFIANSIIVTSSYLGIETEFIISSQLKKENSLKNKEKVLHICSLLGGSTYINAIGGRELYQVEEFAARDIDLKFLKTNEIRYQQFNNEFIPWLSIIDVMMFNSPEELTKMLNNYELI